MSNAPHRDQILIIEDEEIIRISLRKLLERHDYDVSDAVSIKAASETFDFNDFALIISDLRLPGQLGTDLIKMVDPVPVLIMTSYASLRSAVDTMRQGAVDYISKPFDHEEMLLSVRRILSASKHRAVAAKTLGDIALLGSSEAIKKITRVIPKVAASDLPILIQGKPAAVNPLWHWLSTTAKNPLGNDLSTLTVPASKRLSWSASSMPAVQAQRFFSIISPN